MATEPSHPHGGAGAHPEPNYMAVFFALFVLTVAEVAVVFMHFLPRPVIVSCLILLAFAKATCVAAYFMHLRFEKRTLAIIAGTPIALVVFLVLMLLPDAV
jgi:cytochrome c oxidase subunit 4